jgi:centrosomal protein CEP290
LNQLDAKEESCKILKEDLESQQNKLSVIRHQMGLLYEQFYQERKDKSTASDELVEANKQLEENLEAHRAKIEEYESHVDAFNNGEMEQKFADTTRKMVILRSNEALMIRRYRAVEESEKILRKENISLKDEMMIIENKVMEKIGSLQRHKEMATFKIESLQQSQADCVPSSTLKEANSQYADLTARYRHLLEQEQSHSANERRMEELELIVDSLRHEKATLNDELQAAREKLHSCEVMVTRLHDAASAAASVTGDESPVVTLMHDHQLESLTKQIATLELKELNEKQRADHAENKYKLIQAQTNQLEKRNEELEVKFADVTKANLELQRTERELRDTLVTSIAKERFDQLGGKVKKLESVENELRIENDKLKEVADVARNQIDLFETRKNAENVELEALRHEVIDLQSQTDEKSIIGKLHRQIVGFQLRDNEATNKIKQLQNKLAHAEALMFRLQQKADEKEAQSVHVRTQSYIKCRTLFKIIQDLRRQYSGSVPLSRQEKLSEILRELKDDKRKAAQSLKEAEDKLQEAETRADDLAVRQDSVDNLLNALKQGAGTKQVVEWQKRLEELRLRELRSRRQSERWSVEVDHLRELTIGQARRIDQLEEELVRVENQIEAKQLDWETRQVELETLEENGDKKQASAKNRQEQDALMIPNPEWPLAKQLEQSLNMVKAQAKAIDANGTKLTEARKLLEDFKKKLREAEGKVLAKNRIINDLRLQIPNSVDRAMTMASVTGNYGLPVSLTTDYESKQSLSVAQATVVSLRERLSQKEETVSRYERLLKQSRNDFENELRRKQEELVSHKSSIRSQGQVIQELKVSAHNTSAVYANAQVHLLRIILNVSYSSNTFILSYRIQVQSLLRKS